MLLLLSWSHFNHNTHIYLQHKMTWTKEIKLSLRSNAYYGCLTKEYNVSWTCLTMTVEIHVCFIIGAHAGLKQEQLLDARIGVQPESRIVQFQVLVFWCSVLLFLLSLEFAYLFCCFVSFFYIGVHHPCSSCSFFLTLLSICLLLGTFSALLFSTLPYSTLCFHAPLVYVGCVFMYMLFSFDWLLYMQFIGLSHRLQEILLEYLKLEEEYNYICKWLNIQQLIQGIQIVLIGTWAVHSLMCIYGHENNPFEHYQNCILVVTSNVPELVGYI